MRSIIIFIAFCIVRKSVQKVEFYEDKRTSIKEILCVKTAVRKYLSENSNILLFSTSSNNMVNSLPKFPFYLATGLKLTRKMFSVDKGAMIIFLEGNADRDFSGLKYLAGFVMMHPVLVVCITDSVCSSETYIDKIVKIVANSELHYVAVDERGIIDIYEYTTTAEGSCGVAQLLKIGHCSDKSIENKVFKTRVNFHKCYLNIVTWISPPYSETCKHYESDQMCGVEGRALQVVARKINATVVLLRVQTPLDVRRLVAKRYADLGFGKLDMLRDESISYSHPYFYVKATVIAPYSTWAVKKSMKDVLLPLQFEVWVGIGVVIVFIFILRMLISYFRRIHALQVFGMFLGVPVPRQTRGLPSQIYFLSLVLFAYLCSQSYLTNLTKMLLTPQRQVIKTLSDIENSEIRVAGTPGAREKFKDDYPRIYKDFEMVDYSVYYIKLLDLLEGRSSSAFYVEASDDSISEWKKIKAIEDVINWYPVAMVVPKQSKVLKTTSKVLESMVESGILSEYIALRAMVNRYSQNSKYITTGRSAVLKFEDLKGVFLLLISGLSLSFLVFLIEIITPFMNNRGKIHPKLLMRKWIHGMILQRQIFRNRKY